MNRIAVVLALVLVGCGGKKADPVEAPVEVVQQEAPEPVAEAPVEPAPKAEKVFCGGIAGIQCADGQRCVDDPDDACAPPTGADCGGMCVPEPEANQVAQCPDTDVLRYVATAEDCKRIRYACPEGEYNFGDACGCGCSTEAPKK